MQVILNIGLDGVPSDGPGYTNGVRNPDTADKVFNCLRTLREYSFTISRTAKVQSASEPTLVVEAYYDGPGLANSAAMVSRRLKQDCIAVYKCDEFAGDLIGDRAAKWGEFDPEYFFLPSGRTLKQAQDAAERLMQGA